MEFNLKKIIQYICYYILPSLMLISIISLNLLKIDEYQLLSKFGSISLILVMIILFVKPLSVIFQKIDFLKKILMYRREMGVLAFWFAMFHGILLMFYLKLISQNSLPQFLDIKGMLFWGTIALFLMFLLGITSNTLSQIKLKQNWKKLQYLAYFALAFILIHKAIVKNEIYPYFILVLFIVLKIVEKYLIKKRTVFLQENLSK